MKSNEHHIAMTGIRENAEHDNDRKKLRRQGSSITSLNDIRFVNPLMRSVRQGEFSKKSFFQETKSDSLDETDLRQTDNFQRNAFHYAVSKPDTLKEILDLGNASTKVFVQEALNEVDEEGETPIHRAIKTGNVQSAEILYEYDNSLIKLKTASGKRSMLHLAVTSRSVVAVMFVLNKQPDLLNIEDSMSQTAVHYAAALKQCNVLKHLISKGGDTTIADTNGQIALHIAANRGLKENVKLLLRENPDYIDIKDSLGRTPLLLAAQNRSPAVVSYLLSEDADYEIQDKSGLTAFDYAVSSQSEEVVKVFLATKEWKKIVCGYQHGPELCLKVMIENIPETAKKMLDKCLTTKGSKTTGDYKIIYDFLCLQQRGKNDSPYAQYEALKAMIESESQICLAHPVSVKYVNLKWKKRGFKYSLCSIIFNLTILICLMIYTIMVIGTADTLENDEIKPFKNTTKERRIRYSTAPNSPGVMVLRVILLTITFSALLINTFQIKVQGFRFFTLPQHYLEIAMRFMVIFYLLPVKDKISPTHIAFGSFAVLYSWANLIQYLKLVPVMGVYIIVIQKIFWTLMKILLVVGIYLLSFSCTFYVLLTEHDQFSNVYISIVSTFVAMMDGFEYGKQFVEIGWYNETYELKLIILVLFMLVMSIVVNNALIGLAVGDTEKVMKSAKFDKFKRRAEFVIHVEQFVNNIPYLRVKEDKIYMEHPYRKKSLYEKTLYLLYYGSKLDQVDQGNEGIESLHERELGNILEGHIERPIEAKLDNLRSSLQYELKCIKSKQEEKCKSLETKIDMILMKLNETESIAQF